MYDIGKIGIVDVILKVFWWLFLSEMEVMCFYVEIGYRILF